MIFHTQTDQGIRNIPVNRAVELSGTDPDYSLRDLYNSIARKDIPSWTLYIQVMTPEEAKVFKWNIFDVTKVIFDKIFIFAYRDFIKFLYLGLAPKRVSSHACGKNSVGQKSGKLFCRCGANSIQRGTYSTWNSADCR